MNDILPDEVVRWQRLEAAFRRHAELHGFAEVRTPLIEQTSLFRRQVGETTDIVEKEMYSFERHGDDLTVRPEGTPGAARAYVEHQVATKEPVTRWYYLGPMFRGERTFTLTPRGDGTTDFSMVEVFSGVMLPMIKGSLPDFVPVFEHYARDLKREAESRRAS